MAEAVRVEEAETEPVTIVLGLTEREALTLRRLLCRIGGGPNGPRGQLTNIQRALDAAGVSYADGVTQVEGEGYMTTGSVKFVSPSV